MLHILFVITFLLDQNVSFYFKTFIILNTEVVCFRVSEDHTIIFNILIINNIIFH